MSSNVRYGLNTADVAHELADLHLRFAAQGAVGPDDVRAGLDALRTAFEVPWPHGFRHLYEQRLHDSLDWYDYLGCQNACCDPGGYDAWATEWLVSEDTATLGSEPNPGADVSADLSAVACDVCGSALVYLADEICATCFADKELLRDFYDPDWRWDRFKYGE